ncbi:hypothetical protein [Actinopolyspora erythraea]|uniref:hypothetical protein n=1 Tax=Actinopolyspora erythraea TaxID=414996 RepID=UPI001185484F|nr:hypothetical protein [Actinopolyspora erythraea]
MSIEGGSSRATPVDVSKARFITGNNNPQTIHATGLIRYNESVEAGAGMVVTFCRETVELAARPPERIFGNYHSHCRLCFEKLIVMLLDMPQSPTQTYQRWLVDMALESDE